MRFGNQFGISCRTAIAFTGGFGGDSLIRTPMGTRRAELMRPGDMIITRNNGLQIVRAIWKKRLTRIDMGVGSGRAPVRLKPRAIGPMMPQRDLLVAADHRVLVPGYRLADAPDTQCRLVEASELAEASDQAYTDRSTQGVELYTFIFDSHQVFCASGLPVESFLPSASTIAPLRRRLRRELVALFPALRKNPESYPAVNFPQAVGRILLADPN